MREYTFFNISFKYFNTAPRRPLLRITHAHAKRVKTKSEMHDARWKVGNRSSQKISLSYEIFDGLSLTNYDMLKSIDFVITKI